MQRFNKKQLQLFDILNQARLNMTQQFRKQQNPSKHIFFEQMCKIQYVLNQQYNNNNQEYQNMIYQNTLNLSQIIMKHGQINKNQKFNISWEKFRKNKQQQKVIQKSNNINNINNNNNNNNNNINYNINSKTSFVAQNISNNNIINENIKQKVFNHYQEFKRDPRKQQPKFVQFINPKKVQNYQQIVASEKSGNQSCQFLTAAVLPKGTSVRKKFVPPLKKPQVQQQPIKQQQKQEQKFEDNPLYKHLDPKLVQMIHGDILQNQQKISWSSIAGLGFAKKIIHEMIVWPMLRPDIFKGLRAPPKQILLFGPPGTGKTMIGRAIASEAKATFFSITASSIGSKWVGQSQKLVKTLFAVARAKHPSVIFIDQIDSLLSSRQQGQQQSSRKIKTQFLVQLDGAKRCQQRVLIIGATNRPQQLDDAVRRRFIKRLYIPLPNYQGRIQLIKSLINEDQFELQQQQIKLFSQMTKGYSGHDLYITLNQASMMPVRKLGYQISNLSKQQIPLAKLQDCIQALKYVKPSVNQKQLQSYVDWNRTFGSYQFSLDQLQQQQDININNNIF